MTTAWSHLPNAHHIDRILADVKVNPTHWPESAWDPVDYAAYQEVWLAASHAAFDVIFAQSSKFAAWEQVKVAARPAAWDSIKALIAWDETADYLNLSLDQLKMWALLGDNYGAVLMVTAVTAFEKSKELV